MYFLYSVLLTIGFVALLPRFVLDALRHGKYAAGFSERLGWLPVIDAKGRQVVWLHCVSVGETQAARPLVREILGKFPSHALVISTTTLTGQRVARTLFSEDAALVFYFPFDWAWTVRRALGRVNPSAVLIMETELWPRFLRECRKRHMPVALVNGRLSQNSFRRYKFINRFMARVVNDLSLALMQTHADAERIGALGLDPKRVMISGNVKFDAGAETNERTLTGELRRRFHFDDDRPLIVAASTHSPEERIVLEAFKQLRATSSAARARLLIAPRHPERFAAIASLLDSSGFNWARRSGAPGADDPVCDVILLDTIGELRAAYPLASLVFVGGSIAPTGGHNVLEPAAAGACIVTGAHTANFAAIVRAFLEAEALVQLPFVSDGEAPRALARTLEELLADEHRRRETCARAKEVLRQNRGATERTVNRLAPLLAANFARLTAEDQRRDAQRDAFPA